MKSEWDIINKIRQLTGERSQDGKIAGIGDDCAAYEISKGRDGLFSADINIEGVHFDLSYTSLFEAGYRSMSANISDIFASGGKPILTLVSLGIDSSLTEENIEALYKGIKSCCDKYNVFIAGGDISKSEKLVISIAIYGETNQYISRDNAQVGDYIYLTGNTGLSKLGLELLQKGEYISDYPSAVKKHLQPEPQRTLIDIILQNFSPTAMIDISDGMLSDLGHICKESKKGFVIEGGKIPHHSEIYKFCNGEKNKMLDYSLTSGEEYELIFTSKIFNDSFNNITCIGRIIESGFFLEIDNSLREIKLTGYDHFSKK